MLAGPDGQLWFVVRGSRRDTGELVLEPNTSNRCRIEHRWLRDKTGKLRDAAKNDSFIAL
jgi:hypothetical protein